MIPEIIAGSTLGSLTARMLNKGLDRLDNYPGGVPAVNDEGPSSIAANSIMWDTVPDHHGGWSDSGWTCDQWMTWHKRLVEHFGNDAEANEVFMTEWNKQSTWDTQYNWCKYRSDFQDYFKSHGIGVPAVVAVVTNTGETAASVSESAEEVAKEGVGGFGDSVSTLLKWLPWILISATVVFLGLYLYPMMKKAKAA